MKKLKPQLKIYSSQKALKESMDLHSCWSGETILSQRILIYIAQLLKELVSKKTQAQISDSLAVARQKDAQGWRYYPAGSA